MSHLLPSGCRRFDADREATKSLWKSQGWERPSRTRELRPTRSPSPDGNALPHLTNQFRELIDYHSVIGGITSSHVRSRREQHAAISAAPHFELPNLAGASGYPSMVGRILESRYPSNRVPHQKGPRFKRSSVVEFNFEEALQERTTFGGERVSHFLPEVAPAQRKDQNFFRGVAPLAQERATFGGERVSHFPPEVAPAQPKDQKFFKGVAPLAQALVQHCGSLERAFHALDYNRKGKLTRSQWETGLARFHLNCTELCGISSKALYKMIVAVDAKHKGEVTLEAWTGFFEQLHGTSNADLLSEDNGPRVRRKSFERHVDFINTKLLAWRKRRLQNDSINATSFACDRDLGDLWGMEDKASDGEHRAGDTDSGHDCDDNRRYRQKDESSENDDDDERFGECRVDTRSNECNSLQRDLGGNPRNQSVEASSRRDRAIQQHDVCQSQGQKASPKENHNSIHATRIGHEDYPTRMTSTGDIYMQEGCWNSPTDDAPAKEKRAAARQIYTEGNLGNGEGKLPNQEVKHPIDHFVVDIGDLRSLSPDDLDALAEHQQLEEELSTLNLDGVKALAYVLIAKFQSLKKAFKWFDTTRKEHISHVAWDTGLLLLHVNVTKLTGFASSAIFAMMDVDPQDGQVSRKEFFAFFRAVGTDELLQQISSRGTLKERSSQKKQKLLELQAAQVQNSRPVRNLTVDCSPPSADNTRKAIRKLPADVNTNEKIQKTENTDVKTNERKKKQRRGASRGFSVSSKHQETEFCKTGRSHIIEEVEAANDTHSESDDIDSDEDHIASNEEGDDDDVKVDDLGSRSMTWEVDEEDVTESEYEQNFRKRIRSELIRLCPGGCMEYDVDRDSLERSIIEEVAEELGMWSHAPEGFQMPLSARSNSKRESSGDVPGALVVFNLKKFAEETKEKLMGIEPGAHLEFPTSLSESHRRVVHLLAATLGLWTHSEGKGSQRRVVAFNLGDFAEEMRTRLESLGVGECVAFPENLSEAQIRLIRMVACELDYWVETPRRSDSPCSLTVFNFADFTRGVRDDLSCLSEGQHKDFEPQLTEQLRRIVHSVAAELGVDCLSTGEGFARIVSVAKLQDYREEVSRMLRRLAPGQRREFPATLTVLQRKVVRETATEMGFNFEHNEDDGQHIVAVTRPGGTIEPPITSPKPKHRHEVVDANETLDTEERDGVNDVDANYGFEGLSQASVINKLFHAYATGRYKGEAIFLRFPDLREFAEDAKDAMPKKRQLFLRFQTDLENVFDDTLQLQIDMGTRTRKGLTLHWFQVFIQKAMRKIGVGCVGVLYAIISSRL